MSQSTIWFQLKPYLAAFHSHAKFWVIPTVVATVGSVVVALMTPASWKAWQIMEVRNEAIGNQHGQAQFASIDEMKVYQETILEVARSRVVSEAVLMRVGPPANHKAGKPWPTEDDITSLQSSISINPPKGAEWGRTKIFYLSVTARTPELALARTRAVCNELETNLGKLRNANAQSVILELERAQTLAQTDLEVATSKLESLEREVGEDLGELRLLTENGSGDSNLRTTLNQVKQELRQAENARESLYQLKELLETSSGTEGLRATPSRLLDLQPSLKLLKEKLTEAQTDLSKLRGVMSDAHPKVQGAARTERQIRNQLDEEVRSALRGIEADLAANASQIATMQEQFDDVQQRLDRLANLRARYGNLINDTHQRTQTLDSVRQKLANAKAVQNASSSTSLLTRFGEPIVGDRPVGPSKKIIVLAGGASGLALGAGLVFLFMPIGPNGSKRRWADYLNVGRRATDQLLGRRSSDVTRAPNPVTTGVGRRASDG